MNNILIVEDEHLIARLIEMTLTRAGYRCPLAEDGRTAADLIETTNFDMALLDIMLPGLDGYALLECLRPQGVPVIFITAKSAVKDRVQGLRLGADDYITKPFNIREVTARIKAILRRVNPAPKGERDKLIISGDITLDYNFRRVVINDKVIELTSKEFDLLELFMRNPGKVYTRENLLDIAWGFDYPGDVRTVDVHIRRLREKIEKNPAEPSYIKTKWGVGYYYKKD